MKNDKIRLRINLDRNSIGFDSLNRELFSLPDEKAMRMRILTILHEYSQSLTKSGGHVTAIAQLKPAPPGWNATVAIESRGVKHTAVVVETTQADISAQFKAVCDVGGYVMDSN